MAVDASHLYWTSVLGLAIIKANLDGTGATTIVAGQNDSEGVAVGP